MKAKILLKNILYSLKQEACKNILIRPMQAPYNIDLDIFLNSFDLIDFTTIDEIKAIYFKISNITIIDFNNNSYLFKLTEDNSIFIRELQKTKNTLFENNNINKFIYGTKNIKIIHKLKDENKRHEIVYSLINSIRHISNEIIVLLENKKLYTLNNSTNIFNFYNDNFDFENYINYIKNIDFKYLLILDLNSEFILDKFISSFFCKKIFITSDISLNYYNSDVLLLEEKINFKISKFNENNFFKTINRL